MATHVKQSETPAALTLLSPVICRLGTASISQLAEIESEYQPVPWTEKLLEEEFAQSHSRIYGARLRGVLCGYIVFHIIQDEAHILNICVIPSARRAGVATALIDRTCRELYRKAVQWCDLEVRASNRAAQKLYERCGFREIGRRKGYYQENGEDAIILRLNIQDYVDEKGRT